MASKQNPNTSADFDSLNEERLKTLVQGIEDKIAKYGYMVQGITGENPYTYTVGRSPDYEVITSGCKDIIAGLVNEVVVMLSSETVTIQEGVPFTSDIAAVSIDSVEQNLRMKYVYATAPQNEFINENHADIATHRFENPRWIILYTGDVNNLLPGDKGFTEKLTLMLELDKVNVLH